MARRQKEWARRTRDDIFNKLGRVCVKCGAIEELEFDVIKPVGIDHAKRMDWSQRMTFYKYQLAMNNLQVLCRVCNAKKGDKIETAP